MLSLGLRIAGTSGSSLTYAYHRLDPSKPASISLRNCLMAGCSKQCSTIFHSSRPCGKRHPSSPQVADDPVDHGIRIVPLAHLGPKIARQIGVKLEELRDFRAPLLLPVHC